MNFFYNKKLIYSTWLDKIEINLSLYLSSNAKIYILEQYLFNYYAFIYL